MTEPRNECIKDQMRAMKQQEQEIIPKQELARVVSSTESELWFLRKLTREK
jgi:hypothetical protein